MNFSEFSVRQKEKTRIEPVHKQELLVSIEREEMPEWLVSKIDTELTVIVNLLTKTRPGSKFAQHDRSSGYRKKSNRKK